MIANMIETIGLFIEAMKTRPLLAYTIIGAVIAAILLCVIFFVSCGSGRDVPTTVEIPPIATPTPRPSPTPSPTPTPEPTPDMTGLSPSLLTGEWIDEEAAQRRPVAVVINNIRASLPQSGLSQAGVVYEILAEGDVTRLVAIFDDFDSERIGPVRSARDYFIDFALDHDALFVHHGGSNSSYAALRNLRIDRLDGMNDHRAFWRDQQRYRTPGMREHSSYTSAERVLTEFEGRGVRLDKREDFTPGWEFYPVEALPAGTTSAAGVTVPFSRNYATHFLYDPDDKLYYKFLGTRTFRQIDEETGEQLAVTNVLIQLVRSHIIAGDPEGRRNVTTVGSGEGYLLTGGEYVPVRWTKTSQQSPTRWYDLLGNPLRLNTGRTWICVHTGDVEFDTGDDADD